MSAPIRPNYVFVLAPSMRVFKRWCYDNDENPYDRKFRLVTHATDASRIIRCLRWQEGDRAVELLGGDILEPGLYDEWLHNMRAIGCPEV